MEGLGQLPLSSVETFLSIKAPSYIQITMHSNIHYSCDPLPLLPLLPHHPEATAKSAYQPLYSSQSDAPLVTEALTSLFLARASPGAIVLSDNSIMCMIGLKRCGRPDRDQRIMTDGPHRWCEVARPPSPCSRPDTFTYVRSPNDPYCRECQRKVAAAEEKGEDKKDDEDKKDAEDKKDPEDPRSSRAKEAARRKEIRRAQLPPRVENRIFGHRH